MKAFFDRISALPEGIECYAAFGEVDYILKVVAATIEHFEEFFFVLSHIEMIRSIKSIVAMREIKNTTELPIALSGREA